MATITEIDSQHIVEIPAERSMSRVFVPSEYKTFGRARNQLKTLIDNAGGVEFLSQQEKEIVGRWSLISDSAVMDELFSASEQADIAKLLDDNSDDLTFTSPDNVDANTQLMKKVSGITSYITMFRFTYHGDRYSDIYNMKFVSHTESSGEYAVRVVDATNRTIIAERTGNTNTIDNIIEFTSISNIPLNEAVFEVQLRRTSNNSCDIHIHSLSLDAIV